MAILVGLLAAALITYELTRPNVLSGVVTYDEGVFLGGTLKLLHGALPYRDFAYLPPPGLLLFLSPFVALGHLGGDQAAMVVCRLLTGAVAAINVVLAAYLVRYRGVVAVVTAGVAAASLPAAVAADSTLVNDPYYVLFCLIGAVLLFDGTGRFRVEPWRIAAGAAAFGFAFTIQFWAAAPIAALLAVAVVAKLGRRRLWILLSGLVAGAGIPSAPFFVFAPGRFIHDVVVVQLTRGGESFYALSIGERLRIITGVGLVPGLQIPTAVAVAIVTLVALLVVVALAIPGRRPLDVYVGLAAALAVIGVCASPEFYALWGYFPGVFLALACGMVAGRVRDFVALRARSERRSRSGTALPARALVVGGALVVGAVLVVQNSGYARNYLATAYAPGEQLALRIRPGACVVFDEATLALDADRFPTNPACPDMTDPFGEWMADDPAHPPPYNGPYRAALVGVWARALQGADYFVEVAQNSDFVPWTSDLAGYLSRNYVLVYSQPGAVLYERTSELYSRR